MEKPNDKPAGVDLEAGVITLKKGEDIQSFKLNDADDLGRLVKLGQRGIKFDETSAELGQLRTVVQNWDSAIDAARNDEKAVEQLVKKMEIAIGRSLTKKEVKQVDKGEKPRILIDEEENSRLVTTIDSLKSEIANLKQSQTDFKKNSDEKEIKKIQAEISANADALEKKFNGKGTDGKENGSPKFERVKVFQFASEKGIDDLELAFKLLNFDKLTEYSQKKALSEFKTQQSKRQDGFVESGDKSSELKTEKPARYKTYHHLGQDVLKSAKKEGLSLFTND